MSTTRVAGSRYWLHASTTLVFLAITAMGWHLWPNGVWGVYSLTDGALAAWNSASMFAWDRFLDPNPYNFFQGLGSQYIPNTPWLNPGALALSIPTDVSVRYYASYAIYFLEVLVSVLLLARALGFGVLQAVLAAQTYCLVIFPPYSNYFLSLPWMSLAPFNAHLTAMFNVALALYTRLGEGSRRETAVSASLVFLTAIAAFYSSVITSLTYLPAYCSFAVLVVGCRMTRRAISWKLGVVLGLGALSLALGLPQYYSAMAGVTSSHLLTPVVEPVAVWQVGRMFAHAFLNFDWCAQPQIFFCSAYPIVRFHWLAVVGAAMLAVLGEGIQRRLGAWLLGYVAFLHLYAAGTSASLLGPLNRIAVDFLVFSSYPFYALCVVGGLSVFAVRAQQVAGFLQPRLGAGIRACVSHALRHRAFLARSAYVATSLAVVAMSVWLIGKVQRSRFPDTAIVKQLLAPSVIYEPAINPIATRLIDEAALSPGGTFRGFTASYFGSREGPLRKILGFEDDAPSATEIYVESRHYLQARYGNSFMMTDLWGFNIPTFDEYGQMVNQLLYVFVKEMFARPTDTIQSVEINLHRLDIKSMQALGIRFLVTDAELRDPRLRLLVEHQADAAMPPPRPPAAMYAKRGKSLLAGPAVKLRLYEIKDANIASFSPTRVTLLPTAKSQLNRLRDADFLPASEILVTEQIGQPLIRAEQAKLVVHPGRFRITAQSQGFSALLLPVQFSRCLSLRAVDVEGRAKPRLIRANLMQSAIVFERKLDAVVSFDFAPGPNRICRVRDVAELKDLDLSSWRLSATSSRTGILPAR